MGNVYFFTGFPGFIANALIRQFIRSGYPMEHCYLLVLPSMRSKAQQEVASICSNEAITQDRFTILTGDITKPNLGLGDEIRSNLAPSITHVFHLAAIYDLAVPKDIAYAVNVKGTRHVNQWIGTLTQLKRYVYFSTAYVSGTREGRIYETELVMNQSFKNHYEQTKYEAELLVQEIMPQIPTTIIRPGIVKGYSQTGETIKFDGPYFILNFFDRLQFLPLIPYLGSGSAQGNFVPVDYIIEATAYLGHAEIGIGKTYHLTDPAPYQIHELYAMLCEALTGRRPRGRVPLSWAKAALSIPQVRKWLRVEKEAMDYFTCQSIYDNSQTVQDLRDSGIRCPDFAVGIPSMVAYFHAHKHDTSKQLHIR
ncbi:SDR family oxidoreductase [Brevibacillus ginsengisoli]|uniref:SDR family oxidoreductase n=1 Tax=Brevibacillus ginsengisoli TaxID=363854 RepID=UPI003CF08EB6